MKQKPAPFIHNVSYPPSDHYHCPAIGGYFTSRLVEISSYQGQSWLAWQGYDQETGLDHVYAQLDDQPPTCLSGTAGDHARPVVSADQHGADVLWIADQQRLMHATHKNEKWLAPQIVDQTDDWFRDIALWRDDTGLWCALICTTSTNDVLYLYHFDGSAQGRRIATLICEDPITRPTIASSASTGLLLAYDVYRDGHYHIETRRVEGGGWSQPMAVKQDHTNCILPRLTPAADGAMWMSFLAEQIVQRDGVIGRAAHACCARLTDETWQGCAADGTTQIAPLYRGLLPISRYFGYDGLRRNPRLVATTDGAMHMVFEQQRSEEESWDNICNAHLIAINWQSGVWSAPALWRDGGCCFAMDHRTLHDQAALPITYRGEHKPAGNDFVITALDTKQSPDAQPIDLQDYAGWSPYIPPEVSPRTATRIDDHEYQLFFGDFHNHSICSPDAEGYHDELYHFARDVAGLDFVGITDNDYYPEKAFAQHESNHQKRLVNHLRHEGKFIPFAGYEWTFHQPNDAQTFNHRSIVFLDDDQRVVRRIEAGAHTEDAMRQTLSRMNVFAHAHHAQYDLLGTAAEANVEVTSGWAVNLEVSSATHDQLNQGKRFGFIGGSDSHRMTPGLGGALVAIWATELTREAIADALRARRCYATTGNRIAIDFRLDNVFMGGSHTWDGQSPLPFHVSVRGTRPLKSVSIISNLGCVHEFNCNGPLLDATWTCLSIPSGSKWFYLRVEDDMPYQTHPHNVCQAVGPLAWSSPIWLELSQELS